MKSGGVNGLHEAGIPGRLLRDHPRRPGANPFAGWGYLCGGTGDEGNVGSGGDGA